MGLYLLQQGVQTGPHTEGEVQKLLRDRIILPEDLAWEDGMSDWLPLSEIRECARTEVPTSPEFLNATPQQASSSPSQQVPLRKPFWKRKPFVVAALGIAAVLLLVVGGGVLILFRSKANEVAQERQAVDCAKQMVREALKAPSSARFVNSRILVKEHPWYQVFIVVDAQNSFGVPLRSSFLCTLKTESGGKFQFATVSGRRELNEIQLQTPGVLEALRKASGWVSHREPARSASEASSLPISPEGDHSSTTRANRTDENSAALEFAESLLKDSETTIVSSRMVLKEDPWYQFLIVADVGSLKVRSGYVCTFRKTGIGKYTFDPAAGLHRANDPDVSESQLKFFREACGWGTK